MFDDLTNTTLNNIPLSDVKAAPSENSPNDGGFNNEENLRWLTKKLVSKGFVIGDTEEELNNSFSATTDADGNDLISSGMFSLDGYTFKLSDPAHISFDNDTGSGSFLPMDSRYAQRFVEQLTGQGTVNNLNTNLENILRSKYNPGNTSLTTAELKENWEKAYVEGTCLGYIKIKYTGTYAEQITNNVGTIQYKDNIIVVKHITPSSDPDTLYDDQLSDSGTWHKEKGDPFAIVNSSTDIDIYYGLLFKDFEKWNTETNDYDMSQRIEFTDIFSLTFFYDNTESSSKCYPITQSVDIPISGNTMLSNIPFVNCKLTTLPKNLYDFDTLYDANSVRNTTGTVTSATFPDYTTLFDVYTTSELLTNFLPTGNPNNIQTVDSNMSYYCIKNIPNVLKKQYPADDIYIPVSFMTSEGSLTPNGFYVDSTTVSTTYPVEGYLHFIKRIYCKANSLDDADETVVNAVTVKQLCNWTTSDPTYSNFKNLYQTYILPYISMYIHICYSSLLDNVAYGYSNDGTTTGADYTKIKSIGCGVKLAESGYGISGDFDTSLQYNKIKYTYDSDTGTFISSTYVNNLAYRKDLTSDNKKISHFNSTDNIIDNTLKFTYYYAANNNISNVDYLIQFDDPINYLKTCSLSTGYIGQNDNYGSVAGVLISKLQSNGTLATVTKLIADTVSTTPGFISYLLLDKYLMPVPGNSINVETVSYVTLPTKLSTHNIKSLNGSGTSDSVINGMCYTWYQPNWICYVPCVATVKKDSLNYLRGKDFDHPNNYAGLELGYQLPMDVDSKSCHLYSLEISSDTTTGTNDKEKPYTYIDILSKYTKRSRETIINVNKIYGPDNSTVQDIIKETLQWPNYEEVINLLKQNSIVTYPHGRVRVLIGVDSYTQPNVVNITSLEQNKYIDVIIHMNPYYYTKVKELIIHQHINYDEHWQMSYLNTLKIENFFEDGSETLGTDNTANIRIYNYGATLDLNNIADIIIDITGNPLIPSNYPNVDISSCIEYNNGTLWIETGEPQPIPGT